MHIFFVNQSAGFLFIDIVNAFAEAGHKVTLFAGQVEEYNNPLSANVKVVKSPAYDKRTVLFRLVSWLKFSMTYAVHLIICKKPNVILVVTNPPIAPLITYFIAKKRGIPYYILVYDLYPETLIQTNLIHKNSLIVKLWKNKNLGVFGGSEKVFTLSESMRKAVSVYVDANKIKVIPNWVDINYIKPIPREENPFISQHELENKKIVLYSGNMGFTHDLESLIEAARLLQNHDDILFVLIGDGGKRIKLIDMARKYILSNVKFLPYQDKDNFPMAMAAADIGIVTLGTGAEGISVPSKAYVNMAAGVCLLAIAPKESELSRLVETHNLGKVCAPECPNVLARTIEELIENEDLLLSYKNNSRKAAAMFTPDIAKEYLFEINGSLGNQK